MGGRNRPRRRRTALMVLGASLVVVASGCLDADVDVVVADDGSGSFTIQLLMDPRYDDRTGFGSPDALEELAESAAGEIPGAEITQLDERVGDGVRVVLPFASTEDLRLALVAERPVGNRGLQLFRSFDLTRVEDDWALRAVPDPTSVDALIDAFGARGTVNVIGAPTVDFSVTLPGRVRATNASTFSGGTARWKLRPDLGELRMRTGPVETPTSALVVVGAGAGALLLGLVLLMAAPRARLTGATRGSRRARRAREQAAAAAAAGWAPPLSAAPRAPLHGSQPDWESPPPYSSHRPDEPVPVEGSPDAPAAVGASPGGPSGRGPGPSPGSGAPWAPSGSGAATRTGPPALPPGFAPIVDSSFPDSHPPGPPPGAGEGPGSVPPGRANVDHREPKGPRRDPGARSAADEGEG